MNFSSKDDDQDNISDADPSEIRKILQETDDLENNILGKNKTTSSSGKQPASIAQRNKNLKLDDPLADMDDYLGKPTKSSFQPTTKPPLATNPAKKPSSASLRTGQSFDDDEVATRGSSSKPRSLADELFGREQRDQDTSSEFKLGDKYVAMSRQNEEQPDPGLTFGGYAPSGVGGGLPRSSATVSSSRRGTGGGPGLDDEMFNADISSLLRPKTSPSQPRTSTAGGGDQPNPLIKSMPSKASSGAGTTGAGSDWLGLTSQSSVTSERPERRAKTEEINWDDIVIKPQVKKPGSHHELDSGIKSPPHQQQGALASLIKPVASMSSMTAGIVGASGGGPGTSRTKDSVKDSINSSFAESDNVIGGEPLLAGHGVKSGIAELGFFPLKVDEPKASADDGWLNNLISRKDNKKGISATYDSNEIQAMQQKIKQLEYENQDLHMQLQHSRAHYELQIQLVQDSAENRVRMMREDRENTLRLFKEERESLQAHVELAEREKQELATAYKRKADEIQRECDHEIDKLRRIQRDSIELLKQEHEQVMTRVRQMKDTELSAAMSATQHTRTIESVLELIEQNTKNLDGLSQKVQMGHLINLSEQEIKMRTKEESIKIQEERLQKQQKEYEMEIHQLNETICRLENHLAEQSKAVAEERWKSKQQEKRLEALQEALLGEQRFVMEKMARERNDIDRSKDEILAEQKRLMQQVYEEKRKLAEERAQLEATVAAFKDKQHKEALSHVSVEAEIAISTRRIAEEKQRLEQHLAELRKHEEELKLEREHIEERRRELDARTAKLEQANALSNQKYSQAEELFLKSTREKENSMKIFEQANSIKTSHDSRLNQIQQQLMMLNEKEMQVNQEKVLLYKQRQELESFKTTLKCAKCKDPIKDFGLIGLATMQTSGYSTLPPSTLLLNSTGTLKSLTNMQGGFQPAQTLSSELDDAKYLRQIKLDALKDRQFLNEEKQFIDTLKNSSFNNSRSISLNRLNSTSLS